MVSNILFLIVIAASVMLIYWAILADKDPEANKKKFPFAIKEEGTDDIPQKDADKRHTNLPGNKSSS